MVLRSFTENLMTYAHRPPRRVRTTCRRSARSSADAAKNDNQLVVVRPRRREQRARSGWRGPLNGHEPRRANDRRQDHANSRIDSETRCSSPREASVTPHASLQGHGRDAGAAVSRGDGAGARASRAPRRTGRSRLVCIEMVHGVGRQHADRHQEEPVGAGGRRPRVRSRRRRA